MSNTIPGLVITLKATPRPLPRGRHIGGRVVSIANPKAKAFVTALERAARTAVANLGGGDAIRVAFASQGVAVSINTTFPTRQTQRHGQPHTHKPDGDNVAKAVLDCLTRVGALGGDDCRVVSLTITKAWGPTGSTAITVMPVRRVSSQPLPSPLNCPGWLKL